MELVKKRKRLPEPEARYWSLQLLDAMRYMHANQVIHRDLKLGNLFINGDMELRVGDFGLATWLETPTERRRTLCGTPNYIAPEILEQVRRAASVCTPPAGEAGCHRIAHGLLRHRLALQPASGHSYEVDTWSFGVILYTMLVGRPPFETASVDETYQRIRDCSFGFPADVQVSAAARELISWILQKDPAARPSLVQVTQHDFFVAPGAMVPKRLPESSLTSAPSFPPDELFPGAAIVAAQLSQPIAKATGLRAAVQLAKQRAAGTARVGPTEATRQATAAPAQAGLQGPAPAALSSRTRRVSAAPTSSSPLTSAADAAAGRHLGHSPAKGGRPGVAQVTAGGAIGVAGQSSASPLASQHARRAASASAAHGSATIPVAMPALPQDSVDASAPVPESGSARGRPLQARPINQLQQAANLHVPPQLGGAGVGSKAATQSPAAAAQSGPRASQQQAQTQAAPGEQSTAAAGHAPSPGTSLPQSKGVPSRSLFRAASASAVGLHARLQQQQHAEAPPPQTIAEALLRAPAPAPFEDKENMAAHRYRSGIVGKAAATLRAPAVSSAAAAAEDANMGRVAGNADDDAAPPTGSRAPDFRYTGAAAHVLRDSACRDDADEGEAPAADDDAMEGRAAGGMRRAESFDDDIPERLMAAARLRDSPLKQQQSGGTLALQPAFPAAMAGALSPGAARLVARRPPPHMLGTGSAAAYADSVAPPPALTTRPVVIPPPTDAPTARGQFGGGGSSSSLSGTGASNMSSSAGGGGGSSSVGAPGPLDMGYYVYEGVTPREQSAGSAAGTGDGAPLPRPLLLRPPSFFTAAGPASTTSTSSSSAGSLLPFLRSPKATTAPLSSRGTSDPMQPPLSSLPSSLGSALTERARQSLASDAPRTAAGGAGFAFVPAAVAASAPTPSERVQQSENFLAPAPPAAAAAPVSSALAPVATAAARGGGAGTADSTGGKAPSQQQQLAPPSALNDTYRTLCLALASAPPSTPPTGGAGSSSSASPSSRGPDAIHVSPAAGVAPLPLPSLLASAYAWADAPPTLYQFSHPTAAAGAVHAEAASAVWVTTWLDYTAKYGLGYLLSSGDVGVYFNDSTKILLRAGSGGVTEYTERAAPGAPTPAPQRFSLDAAPPALHKKVTLLRHFQGCLAEKWGRRKLSAATAAAVVANRPPPAGSGIAALSVPAAGTVPGAPSVAHADTLATAFRPFAAMAQAQPTPRNPSSPEAAAADPGGASASLPMTAAEISSMDRRGGATASAPAAAAATPAIFVKKWVRTRRAVLFRLSNRTLQVSCCETAWFVFVHRTPLLRCSDAAGRLCGRLCSAPQRRRQARHDARPCWGARHAAGPRGAVLLLSRSICAGRLCCSRPSRF